MQGYIAREDDVRDAIAFYDAQGTRARRRGPDKQRKDGEFITPGPDFLSSARRSLHGLLQRRMVIGRLTTLTP
jgi:hypothetical protein